MSKVYLASPFFNDKEIEIVKQVEKVLEEKGLTIFSPRLNQLDHLTPESREWSVEIFRNDVKYIDWCDFVVAIYHGNYSDSGTAWEIGYAFATNKPVIVVHAGSESNLMVHEGCHANIALDEISKYDFELLPSSVYHGKMF